MGGVVHHRIKDKEVPFGNRTALGNGTCCMLFHMLVYTRIGFCFTPLLLLTIRLVWILEINFQTILLSVLLSEMIIRFSDLVCGKIYSIFGNRILLSQSLMKMHVQ